MSGVTPPQPLADFGDRPYIRGEDIIRPKPRRLVDMRRSALEVDPSTFTAPSGKSDGLSIFHSGGMSSNTNMPQLPPILPKAGFGGYSAEGNNNPSRILSKPLPPRPSSTSKQRNLALDYQRPQSQSPLYIPMGHYGSSPQKSFAAFNQRSVPNLPQLLIPSSNNMYTPTPTPIHQQPARGSHPTISTSQHFNFNSPQKRVFLSPQPTQGNFGARREFRGSSGDLLNDEEDSNTPYYSELTSPMPGSAGVTPPHHNNGGIPIIANPAQKPPRVRVEWKSVDNLQKHNGPRFTTTNNDIDISGPPTHNNNVYNSPLYMSSVNVKSESYNVTHHSPMSSTTPSSGTIHGGNGSGTVQKWGGGGSPETSPEYDRIKSPTEINQELKERFSQTMEYVGPHPAKPSITNKSSLNHVGIEKEHGNNSALNSALLTEVVTGKKADDTSLGRSSTTSDGEFNMIGEPPGNFSLYIANTGLTGSGKNKCRSAAPSSKLKSRRKNILHNLSSDEMHLLTSDGAGPQRYVNVNNTGTGGSSSSDGTSSGISMSDSQTSGSPPAEYTRPPGALSPTTAGSVGQISLTLSSNSGYKSLLKSVPEDEGNAPSGIAIANHTQGKFGNKGGSSERKSLEISGKKSSRSKHRNKEPILLSSGNNGLEDIKQAIEQLTLRSHGARETSHHSYSTSTYSSMSGSECDRRRPHLLRYSSLDTINTQVTSADEFVWVDSHSRLVELQHNHVPWSNHDILRVIEKSSKLKENLERIQMETVPRVSYLLQRALVRIARETQRLAKPYGFCSKHEVSSALRIVLSPALADSCSKACLRAAAMFSVSNSDPLHRESKASRAGLNLHVGRFHRWMIDVRLGRFVHEFAVIHLSASMENLIEEILGQALNYITLNSPEGTESPILTAALLEQSISTNGDLWGLLQPYAHLNAGRNASGALALPRRWPSAASVDDSTGSSSTTIGPSAHHDDASLSGRSHNHNKSLEQSLLTTCVGSAGELADAISRVSQYHYKQIPLSTTTNGSKAVAPSWSPSAVQTLFYFMRCSQLENLEDRLGSTATLGSESLEKSQHHGQNKSTRSNVQELVYERPFIVLPPLIEWIRVTSAHADHRHSQIVDKDDVMQAARLLLPGIDCPIRYLGSDEFSWPRRSLDEFECNRRLKIDLAFKMLTSQRSDLVAQALLLMPPSKANTFNEAGLTPLHLASIRGEEKMVRVLLEAGADVDAETPPNGPNFPQANGEHIGFTALTYAALMGHTGIVKILLEKNCNVEGGAKLSEEKSTQTPLGKQHLVEKNAEIVSNSTLAVASASGNMELVSILLKYGSNPFQSTLVRDSLCYTGAAQRGSFSAISVAAAHGHRAILHKLLSQPFSQPSSKEVLSLEEILAEGAQPPGRNPNHMNHGRLEETNMLSKSQVKVMSEALYQSSENGNLDITLDLRNMGIPWTLHCWINTLTTAYDLRCDPIIDQLLQDFLQILSNEDFSQASFVEDCLPLLFTIFRNSKNEGSTILLANIFQICYGRELIKEIRDTSISNGTRIGPQYVNNPELSDVQFRVEGKVFYAHKIVLMTSSQRFKSMLKNASDSNPPVIQINDVRYPIFQMVMEYLYNGSSECIRNIEGEDVLELMAAANFFQLDGLLRFCESRHNVTFDTIVSMYIHAKVYNAVQLLEYCQGFILQNMVALLTYDDSVRRLIFGKKLQNHDILAGLLLTLQARLKSRPNNSTRKSK